MVPVLKLGPFVVSSVLATLLAATWLGMEMAEREGKRHGFVRSEVSNTLSLALAVGIIGARLAHVARYWSSYQSDLTQVFALTPSALDPLAGVLFGLLAAYIYLQGRQIAIARFLDALASALALVTAVVSFGNLLSGDAFGAPAGNLPWAIELWGERRHPSQVYEFVVALAVFVLALRYSVQHVLPAQTTEQHAVAGKATRPPFDGFLFLMTTALLAGVRLFLEAFRGDSTASFAGLRDAQVLSLLILLAALWLLARNLKVTAAPSLAGEKADAEARL